MSQIQIGTCMGFVVALIVWALILEVKNYYLTIKISDLERIIKDESAAKNIKSLDQSGIDKLLSKDFGPGKKD